MRKITIRKASIEDLKTIKQLNQELFCYDFNFDNTLDIKWPDKNEDYYKRRIAKKDSITLIAEDGEEAVGYLIGTIIPTETYRTIKTIAELENMFVIENHRGKGVGKLLINSFLNWAKTNSIKRLKVVTSAKNKNAIEVYRKIGFLDHDIVLEADLSI